VELLCAWAAALMVYLSKEDWNKQTNFVPCLQHTIASSAYRK
jgi:hypothetical protein